MHLRPYKIDKKKKKEDKNRDGQCWMKFVLNQTFRPTFSGSSNQIFMLDAFEFVLNQTFRPTFSGSSNQIFMLDAFEYSFIQHLVFHHCVECKAYAVECVSNVFIDIRMSIICGVPQKTKRREGHKQDKREEAKMACKKEKDSNTK